MLTPTRKYLLGLVVQFYFSHENFNSEEKILENILNSYVVDKFDDSNKTFVELKVDSSNSNNKIKVHKAIDDRFIQKNMNIKSSVFKILFQMYQAKMKYEKDEAVGRMISFMKDKEIKSFYKYIGPNRFDLISLQYSNEPVMLEVIKKSGEKDKTIISTKETLTKKFNSICTEIQNSKFKVEENEIIRLLNAVFRYRNSSPKISKVLYDFSYGFYPVRNYEWIRSRLLFLKSYFLSSKDRFIKIMKAVKQWKPDLFSLEERINYMISKNIFLSEEQLSIYKKLVEIDIKAWNESKIEIENFSLYDIFYGIVSNHPKYISFRIQIKKWSENYDKSPVKKEKIIISDYVVNGTAGDIFLIQDIDISSAADLYCKKLFNLYKYSFFNMNNLDTADYSKQDINSMIEHLIKSNKIYSEDKDLYGIYVCMNGKNLTLNHFKNVLQNILKEGKVFTSNECRAKINSKLRPSLETWDNIIDTLIQLKYIIVAELSRNKTKKIKLS